MENIRYPIEMVIPFFQTPNNIFDLDINIVGYKVDKVSKKIKKEIRVMKPHEKLVYIYLCRCGNNGGQAFPSYGTIARKCSISRRTAIDTIKILKENKLIVKKSRTKDNNVQNSNAYFVLPPSAGNSPSSACDAPLGEYGALGSACDAPKKELIKKNYFKKNYLSNNKNKEHSTLQVYTDNISKTPGKLDIEILNKWINKLGEDIVVFAINVATKANIKRLSYIDTILTDWEKQRIETVEQAVNYTANRNKKKSKNIRKEKVDSFNDYEQRTYDYEELEKKLLGWDKGEEDGNTSSI